MYSKQSMALTITLLSVTSFLCAQEPTEPRQATASVTAAKLAKPTEFLRLAMEDGEPKSLDTAVVTYRSTAPGGVQVDLIGAVHIGENQYYEDLNRLFDSYDVLLYELVAPDGTVIPKGGKRDGGGTNPVSMLQDGAKNMLGLESQLERIDYTKPHFVRADMTPTQIAEKMSERGDTAFTLALSTFADAMRQQNLATHRGEVSQLADLEDLSLFDLMGNPLKMKRVLAQQFAATGSLDQALGGALNQLLIVDRNSEALKGLQKQIALGKKRIGIFYGAAHLPNFEKRLVDDFGLVKSATNGSNAADASSNPRWLVAWDLTKAKEPQLSEPASLLLNFLKVFED
jgi:hypothetical protein